jgi:hypothetical protein
MAVSPETAQNRPMKPALTTETKPNRRKSPRIVQLEAEIDERDKTIRLLNEALSRALDELNMLNEAA